MLAAAELVIAQGIQKRVDPRIGPLIGAGYARADAAGVRVVGPHTALEDLRKHARGRATPAFAVLHVLVVLVCFVAQPFLDLARQVGEATLDDQARAEDVAVVRWLVAELGAGLVDGQQAGADEQVLTLCDEQAVFGVDGWISSRRSFGRLGDGLGCGQHRLVDLAEALDLQSLDRVQAEDLDELRGPVEPVGA